MEYCTGHGMTRMAVKEILTEEDKNALKSIGFVESEYFDEHCFKNYDDKFMLTLSAPHGCSIDYSEDDVYCRTSFGSCDMGEPYCDITRLIMLGIIKIEK